MRCTSDTMAHTSQVSSQKLPIRLRRPSRLETLCQPVHDNLLYDLIHFTLDLTQLNPFSYSKGLKLFWFSFVSLCTNVRCACVAESPLQFYVNHASSPNVTAYGPGLSYGMANKMAKFTVFTEDTHEGEA